MCPYLGGSAPAMAHQIAEGYTALTKVHLKRLSPIEHDQLEFELDKVLRMARGEQVPVEDHPATNAKNRKLARIAGALAMLRATRFRGGAGG